MNNNVNRKVFINCLPYKLIYIACEIFSVYQMLHINYFLFQAPSRGHKYECCEHYPDIYKLILALIDTLILICSVQ